VIFNFIFNRINHLGYPTYISPLQITPPIPSEPYLVLFKSSIKFIVSCLFVSAMVVAIMAGSKAWILTLLGLDAKLAPHFINSS